jgi:hypothetical protein
METRRVYDEAPQFGRGALSTGRRDLELIQEHHEGLLRKADRQRLVRKLRAARRKVHPLLRGRAQTMLGALRAPPAKPSAGLASAGLAR